MQCKFKSYLNYEILPSQLNFVCKIDYSICWIVFPHSLVPWWDFCGWYIYLWWTGLIVNTYILLICFFHLMLYYLLSGSSIFRLSWMFLGYILRGTNLKKKYCIFINIKMMAVTTWQFGVSVFLAEYFLEDFSSLQQYQLCESWMTLGPLKTSALSHF